MKTITIQNDYITVDGVKYFPKLKEDKTELVVGKWSLITSFTLAISILFAFYVGIL